MAREQTHSEEVRQEALVRLRANRGNVLATAREMGLARNTLVYWRDQERRRQAGGAVDRARADSYGAEGEVGSGADPSDAKSVEVAAIRQRKEAEVRGRLHTVRDVYSEWLLNPDVVAATSAKDAAIIVGITTEKLQLLEGKPTARTEHRVVRYVDKGALRDLAARARAVDVTLAVRPAAQLTAGDPRDRDNGRVDEHTKVAASA